MRKLNLHFLSLILFFPILLSAQSLPAEMKISADGRMLLTGAEPTTGFYDESVVREIEFIFSQSSYWSILTNNYNSGTDLMASVIIDGVRYDSVGIRFKGMTSFFRNNSQKKSFNVTLDFMKDQDVMGYETLNLNCGFDDHSSIKEALYNHIGRQFSPALKTNFAHLKINGQDWGPYSNVQQLNGEFFKEWFFSNDGTSWRALRTGGFGGPGGNPFGTGRSTLNYNGPDSTDYNQDYQIKRIGKARPWDELILATDKLNNLPLSQLADSLKYYIDVDKALWYLAREIIFSDDDGYVWKGGMDYYVYWDKESGLIIPLEYDGNTCMESRFSNWSPFYNEQDARFPLIHRLFAVPELRQRYLAHVRTILDEYMDPIDLFPVINGYVIQLNQLVQNDPKKIYSYQEWADGTNDLRNFITTRRSFLLNNTEVRESGLDISQVQYAVNGNAFQRPEPGEVVDITATISGTTAEKVWLYHAQGFSSVFEKTEMFDDGMHNDGAAGDGLYGAAIPGYKAGTYVRYYIEGIAGNTAKTATYMPPGAEHDVYIYHVFARASANTDVVINELMASNTTAVADPAGEYDDWIELYNTSNQIVDLSGFFLSDKADNPGKWEIPQGTTIGPNGYLIIWADENGSQGDLHANFKLSASGELVILSDPDTLLVDEVTFGQQQTDMGYARVPNGTGNFVIQAPTFNANNDNATAIDDAFASINMFVFPNPARDWIQVEIQENGLQGDVFLFNAIGQKVAYQTAKQSIRFDTSALPAGMYFISYQGNVKRVVISR